MRRRSVLIAALAGLLVTVVPATAHATFPGANGKIAFSYCGPEDCGIFVMEPDGSGRTQITHNPYTYTDHFGTHPMRDSAPAWAPRGDRIAFVRQFADFTSQLMVANADGSEPRALGTGYSPTWSPDGTKIAFENNNGIYAMNADGSGETLVHQGRNLFEPDWSPDGTLIAYTDSREEGWQDPEIWVVPAGGGTPTSLTPPDFSQGSSYPRSRNFGPSWSPDSARIAFASSEPGYQWDLYTIRADGTDKTRVTFTDKGFSPVSEENASWSPDGTMLAYERSLGGVPPGIVVTTADGAEETFLGPGFGTAWQPLPANSRPDCAGVNAHPHTLQPANKRLRPVALSGATDAEGDALTYAIDAVTQDEPVGRAADAIRHSGNTVLLRAQRQPRGDGRVYRIEFTASDGKGGECSGTAGVEVRRHKNRPAVDSAPPSYDSFTPSTTP